MHDRSAPVTPRRSTRDCGNLRDPTKVAARWQLTHDPAEVAVGSQLPLQPHGGHHGIATARGEVSMPGNMRNDNFHLCRPARYKILNHDKEYHLIGSLPHYIQIDHIQSVCCHPCHLMIYPQANEVPFM